jgi:hypothetical protein
MIISWSAMITTIDTSKRNGANSMMKIILSYSMSSKMSLRMSIIKLHQPAVPACSMAPPLPEARDAGLGQSPPTAAAPDGCAATTTAVS